MASQFPLFLRWIGILAPIALTLASCQTEPQRISVDKKDCVELARHRGGKPIVIACNRGSAKKTRYRRQPPRDSGRKHFVKPEGGTGHAAD